jgi:C-terminal processing protease CtpA/Prc
VDAFLAAVRARRIDRIAIDVRRNGGGASSVLDAWLRHLPADKVRHFTSRVRDSAPARERGYQPLPLWATQLGWGPPKPGESWVRPARPEDPGQVFRGQVFVLISHHTFSSGNWFAVVLQDNRLAQVVGAPTGNAPTSYGDALRFSLPRSGLGFQVSFKQWVRPDPTRDPAEALAPDVLVPTTLADLRAGRDPLMAWLGSERPAIGPQPDRTGD